MLLQLASSSTNRYHNELPQILADGGGAGKAEESMTYAERNEHLTGDDNVILEEKWRSGWLKHMVQWEVQIQILLYFLKLSLPRPYTPLPPVELLPVKVPPMDNILFILPVKPSRLWKKKREKPKLIILSSIACLKSFMDKFSILGNVMQEDEDAEGKMWLPNSSPDVLLQAEMSRNEAVEAWEVGTFVCAARGALVKCEAETPESDHKSPRQSPWDVDTEAWPVSDDEEVLNMTKVNNPTWEGPVSIQSY
ncbi:hypothetical protein BD769DRAFT_1389771 [Suillus cothurnatus]|nr:hypothetical protein BD769DRAFT_1389771 [Suillus cothurnatus]